jgi:adhesin/invasin
LWRVLWPIAVVAGGAITCDAPTSPGRRGTGYIAVAPVFSRDALGNFSGLTVDQVRITVIRPPSDTLARVTIPFSVDSTSVTARVPVVVNGSELLSVIIEMLAGAGPAAQVVFTGTQSVQAVQGVSNPPPVASVPVTFVGPGTQIASLLIQPRDSGTIFGATVPFRVTAFDSQSTAVPQFYVSWSTSSTAHTINALGEFDAGNSRGTVWVFARTPTGIRDSTRLTISPVATQLQILAGNSQTGAIGTALPTPLAVRVLAADNLPVAGVPITFSVVSGGGAVAPLTVATDSLGVALTTATLGPATGANTFRAAAPGLSAVTFTATASSTPGVPTTVIIAAGNNQSAPAGTAVPIAPRVRVLDGLGTRVGGVNVTFAVATGGGSVTGASVVTDTGGFAQVGSWTLGGAAGANTLSATVTGLAPVTFTATGTVAGPPVIVLSLSDTMVGIGTSPALQVRLLRPAPVGGLTVSVVSDSVAYLTVAAPGTIAFPAGDSIRTINVTGVAAGLANVLATATGYTPDTLLVIVLPRLLNVASGTVSVGQSVSIPVTALPRPLTALTITLTSSDTTIARVTTPTLNLAANQGTVNVTVQGVAVGTVGILATAPGYAQGGNVVTVGSGGVPASLTKTAGDNQTAIINDTLAIRPQVRVLDAGGAPVVGVIVNFLVTGGGGSMPVISVATNATGFASAGAAWRMGSAAGANQLTAQLPAFPGVPLVLFSATAVLPPPQIVLSVFGSTVVGQARTGQLDVRLLQAAPVGGLTVTLTSTRTGLLRIGSYASENGSALFAQGDTLKSVVVFGDSLVTGTDTVIATATGYTPDTLAVPISLNLISLPGTLNVPLSQNVSLPINLSVAAPAGGIVVSVVSSNPATVLVVTPTVTVPAGSQVANATVQGAALGTATLTATNPNYAPDVSTVSVTASLNIIQTSIVPNASFGVPITIQLESGGLPVSAPAGGIAVTLTPRNTACAAAPGVTIGAGQVNTTASITYGGSAALPCTTYVVASGPAGFAPDSVFVSMQPQPALTISNTFLGSGLQRAFNGSTGASNHGGTTVRVTSTNPSLFLISLTDSTVGSTFVDVPVNIGGTNFLYYVQALEGFTNDSANVTAMAPGFTSGSGKLNITQPVFDIIFLNGSASTRAANDPFQVRTGSSSTPAGPISVEDVVRSGGVTTTFSVVNDSAAVGNLVTQTLTADSVTVQIGPRQSRSPTTVATGGVEFDYTAAGVTTVRAHGAGYRPVTTAISQAITVTAPVLTINPTFIGARLQRAVSGSLSAATVTGDTVTLRTTRPGVLKISPNDSTGFADSIQIAPAVGATSFTWYIQGVDTITADSADVIAALPAFRPDTARYSVFRPVFDIIFLNASGNTRSANDPFQVRTGSAASATGTISTEDVLRFGHAPVTFNVINDSLAVADLITLGPPADSVTVQIAARQSRSPTTVATGGVELDYTAGGVTSVRANSPLFRSVGAALGQAVTVTQPVLTINPTFIGAQLQRPVSGSLSAAAVAGDTVTLKTARPGVLRISPNDSTGFADSIRIAMPVGASSFTYHIQGVDTVTNDTVSVLATLTAFRPDTAKFTVLTPVFDIIFLNTTANTLAANDPFQVRTGSASTPTGSISTEDVLRFGHAPVTATVATSTASVAQLVTSSTSGSTATVAIQPRQARSPSTVALGGVELDYLTTGTTVVTASLPTFRTLATDTQTVTVTAPFTTLTANTVGAGLQDPQSGSLSSGNHGGINVVVKSSNPGTVLVSPNATTPGTDSIIIAVPVNGTSFSYYVQGVENATGTATIRATASGFTDGTATATVVQPAVDVIFLVATGSAATAADDPFQVRVGYANSPTNSAMSVEQSVRAGATGPLTVTIQVTDSTFGLLKTTAQPTGAGTVTVQIAVGQARSVAGPVVPVANSVSFDFVAQGILRVVPTIGGYITVKQSSPFTQPGFQVSVTP